MEEKNYVSFLNDISVKQIKVSSKKFDEFKQALEDSESLTDKDNILVTQYSIYNDNILAGYFDPRGIIKDAVTFSLYRKTPDQDYWSYVCDITQDNFSVMDYGIVNDQYYSYFVLMQYDYIPDPSQPPESKITYGYYDTDNEGNLQYIKTKANSWILCDVEETDQDGVYKKIGRTWNLGLQLSDENVTQNINTTTWDTLGRFPRVSYGQQNYDSMTFTGLLGNFFCYDEYVFKKESKPFFHQPLIVESSVVKNNYTEKIHETVYDPENDTYMWKIVNPWATEAQKLQEWKDYITNGNLKLLKDLKGNSWIIDISDNPQYKINNQSNLKQTEVSFSWKQVEDATTCQIIKNNNEEVG